MLEGRLQMAQGAFVDQSKEFKFYVFKECTGEPLQEFNGVYVI